MGRLLSARELTAWAGALLLVATLIATTGFTSRDPDSALYAGISARLSAEPVGRWVAPEWWGFWPEARMTGLFQEHPAGVFLVPAALARLGVPAEQAAYIVGVAAGLASLLVAGWLVAHISTPADGRAAVILLQVMPLAFVFRIRANHEYPMLLCLLLTVAGLEGSKRSRWWMAIAALGLVGGLLIKGVFVAFIVLAAAVWAMWNPAADTGPARPMWTALAVGVLVMVGAAVAWDQLYQRATGDTFWAAYWARQLGPLAAGSAATDGSGLGSRLLFYVSRLLWHPAPWSLVLLWAAFRPRRRWRALTDPERRGLVAVAIFVVVSLAVLILPGRFAERYAFSAAFLLGTAGAVVSARTVPTLGRGLHGLERSIGMLPVVLWTVLALARLVAGPLLPRLDSF